MFLKIIGSRMWKLWTITKAQSDWVTVHKGIRKIALESTVKIKEIFGYSQGFDSFIKQ